MAGRDGCFPPSVGSNYLRPGAAWATAWKGGAIRNLLLWAGVENDDAAHWSHGGGIGRVSRRRADLLEVGEKVGLGFTYGATKFCGNE